MAILPDSFKAFRYQTGIDRVCDAYRASANKMNEAFGEAKQSYAQYDQAGVDDSEYDEDGILLGSTAHSLAQAEMDAILAVIVAILCWFAGLDPASEDSIEHMIVGVRC